MTQAQELWAIKSPEGNLHFENDSKTEYDAWDYTGKKFMGWSESFVEPTIIALQKEGYRAVRVRVEEIEGNESDDSKEKGGE